MTTLLNSAEILDIVSVKCHHFNLTICIVLHNFFGPSKYGKTITRNLNYLVFFKNPSDLRELRNISCQITPTHPTFMQTNFAFLAERFPNDPSHYVFVDGHFRSKHPDLFVRSHIFPDNEGKIKPIIFFPNNELKK